MLGSAGRPAIRAPHYVRATTLESLFGGLAFLLCFDRSVRTVPAQSGRASAAPGLARRVASGPRALKPAATPRRKGGLTVVGLVTQDDQCRHCFVLLGKNARILGRSLSQGGGKT